MRFFWKLLAFVSVASMLPCITMAQMLIPQPLEMKIRSQKKSNVRIVDERIDKKSSLPDEGYIIDVRGSKVIVRAKDERGLIWARQTLSQLKAEDGLVPDVLIKDYPAFPIRGFMHDTGRNFRTVEMLKKDLDLFSQYKLNVFHWHLTDNPAWRIECRAYPQLNAPENMQEGRDPGKFYTYDDIRDVINYARERGIMIIPEIDMPGHSQYFKKTFGFEMASEDGKKVLEACLGEFFSEIPVSSCPYIHIGSDEVRVKDPEGFMRFCENILIKNGRTPIAWDPGLPPSDITVGQIWRGTIGEEIEAKGYDRKYIDSYHGYLNNENVIYNTTKYLLHHYCNTDKANNKALGAILCLWNDLRLDDKSLLFQHNGMPNGLLSFAERIWNGGKGVSIAEEDLIPERGTEMYERIQEFEKRLSWHRDHLLYDYNMRWVANSMLNWKVSIPVRRGTDPSEIKYECARGGVINMLSFSKKYGVKVGNSMDAWAETRIYAKSDTVMKALVGFEALSRSNRISHGIGQQGEFEADGRVFVNGNEVFPSQKWNEPGAYQYHDHTWGTPAGEIPYTAEQLFWMREPAVINLKAGWNTIRVFCPRVFDNNNWVMTFIPVTVDSNNHISEARGFVYGD